LGVQIDPFDLGEMVERIAGYLRGGRSCQVITVNPEFLYNAQGDPSLRSLAQRADLVTADGIGVVWACKVAGTPVPERVTGIDLMMALARQSVREGWGIFLLGAAPGVAEAAALKLGEMFPGVNIVGTHHGYFTEAEEGAVVEAVQTARPDLLFVALGAPRQEEWIDRYLPTIGPAAAVGVGGSFDVLSGKVSRAPGWVQRLHCEWLYRLLKDPGRWRRQLVLPRFVWLVLRKYK